jgi:hypothetical protein
MKCLLSAVRDFKLREMKWTGQLASMRKLEIDTNVWFHIPLEERTNWKT